MSTKNAKRSASPTVPLAGLVDPSLCTSLALKALVRGHDVMATALMQAAQEHLREAARLADHLESTKENPT